MQKMGLHSNKKYELLITLITKVDHKENGNNNHYQ
jgi:hypothetical protein